MPPRCPPYPPPPGQPPPPRLPPPEPRESSARLRMSSLSSRLSFHAPTMLGRGASSAHGSSTATRAMTCASAPKTREVPAAADAGEEAGQGVEDTEDIAAAWAERRAIRKRQKMHELLSPPTTMTFSMTGAEVDLMDDRDRKRAFMTDGRKLQKSKDDRYQEIAAKWDGNRLVTEEKSPRGGKMSRTFELSPDGRQLCENLRIESSGGKHRSLDVHYVYDILAQADRK